MCLCLARVTTLLSLMPSSIQLSKSSFSAIFTTLWQRDSNLINALWMWHFVCDPCGVAKFPNEIWLGIFFSCRLLLLRPRIAPSNQISISFSVRKRKFAKRYGKLIRCCQPLSREKIQPNCRVPNAFPHPRSKQSRKAGKGNKPKRGVPFRFPEKVTPSSGRFSSHFAHGAIKTDWNPLARHERNLIISQIDYRISVPNAYIYEQYNF